MAAEVTVALGLANGKNAQSEFLAPGRPRVGAMADQRTEYPLLRTLQTIESVDNPLDVYPYRNWERVYRDQYSYDDSFTFICSPNDTHACRLRAFTRNGVIQRIEQNYDVGRYTDQLGNKASVKWHPRGCKKGQTFHRRVYGPYRLRFPLVRAGWKEWADSGFPELTPEARDEFKFTSRGTDTFVRLSWDEAYDYVARGLITVAEAYSGAQGARRLAAEGFQPEMIDEMGGAGTRTMKLRGGMGLLGVIGKYGMYRMSNTLALLDTHVRGTGPDDARAGRNWSNYTWHGDQAPGHLFVHGVQTSEPDFNDLANSKLTIQVGKNLVENKMPESHFFSNVMEQGGKIVTIAPEYSPYGTYDGMTIFEAAQQSRTGQQAVGYIPTDEEWASPNIHEDSPVANAPLSEGVTLPEHKTWFFYLQRICNHCSYPACLSACPRNAIYKRPEDGIVLIDQRRCRGYRKCVEQCPYKKPMYRPDSRTSEKCIGCYPRVEGSDPLTEGLPMETRCMTSCPGQIRLQGLVRVEGNGSWVVAPDNPLYYLIREEKMALPLYPQFGTQPNVYYIPPRWVPRDYLRQMFGPGVDTALTAYERPSRRAQAVLQLFRTTQTIILSPRGCDSRHGRRPIWRHPCSLPGRAPRSAADR